MKKKNVLKILMMFIVVSLCLVLKSNVQAMTPEEAGKYVAEFAINFFDAHNSETKYGCDGRAAAYKGQKYNGVYQFDCVGWLSFAVHQATGYGNQDFTEFAVPYHEGSTGVPNKYPGYFNGYTTVYGKGGSNNKIPLDELKQQLKPGDLLMCIGPRKHVLLYVGDNTLIHSTGHGPGSEYGGDSGYALVKESLDHFYNAGYGIEAIGRLTDSAAASINEANCTTIFGQAGAGLTGVWEKASQGGVGVTSSNSSSSNLASKLSVTGMNEDLSLGLRYPKDNSNTPLNSFIDFTLPYLQTWMIPLAMNSGIMTKTEDKENDDYILNPMFGYLTIKEAMSDVLVERYDITTCTLKTKYKVYDVITYSVSYDEEEKKWVKTETSRTSVDESSNGAMAEEYVSKSFDVETKYYIKKAYTFDVKIDNECTYTKYSDSDVENRIEDGVGFQGKNIDPNGGNFSEGGDPGPDGDSKDSYSYTVKDGHYVNVTRTWKDNFEPNDNTQIEPYTVDDVEDYIKNGGAKKQTTAGYSQTGEIYNCKGYELTDEQKKKLAAMIYQEFAMGGEDGLKDIASQMPNLYEYQQFRGEYKNTSFYDYIAAGSWFAANTNSNSDYTDEALQAVEQCIVNGQRTLPPWVSVYGSFHEVYSYVDKSQDCKISFDGKEASTKEEAKELINSAVSDQTIVTASFGNGEKTTYYKTVFDESGDWGVIYSYYNEFKEYCEQNQNYTTTGDGSKSTTTSSIKSLDNFLFLGDDLMYGVKESGKISSAEFVNVVGSTPETWKKWLNGEQTKFDNDVDFSGKKLSDEEDIKGVCMMVGVNALNSDTSVDQVISDMKEVIDKLCDKYSSVPVYIAKVLHVRDGEKCSNASEVNEKIKTFNKEISSYCTSKGALCIDLANNYVGTDNYLKEDKSKDGIHLNDYDQMAENIKNAIVGSDVTNNPVDTSGLENFNVTDREYYRKLAADDEINRVDMMNARPENYLQYMNKGAQYSNHVGHPRGQQLYCYAELERLFKEYFEGNKLPFAYGSSLGYETYKADSYILDAGTVSGSTSSGQVGGTILGIGDLTGTGIEVGTALTSSAYTNAMQYFDTVVKYSEICGLDPYLVIAVIAQETGGRNVDSGPAIGLMQWEKTNGQSATLTRADGTKETITFTFDQLRKDTDLQIKVGCAALKSKFDSYNGNVLVALQGYNYGSGGIKRCVCHYISGGKGSGTYFGVSDEEYKEYLKTNDTGWISSTSWYTSTGHTAFKGAGGGDAKYLSHVLRYYNQEEAQKLN